MTCRTETKQSVLNQIFKVQFFKGPSATAVWRAEEREFLADLDAFRARKAEAIAAAIALNDPHISIESSMTYYTIRDADGEIITSDAL